MYRYALQLTGKTSSDPAVRRVNQMQRMLARMLVTLSYSQDGRFRQDPARGIPAVPELASIDELANVEPGSDRYFVLQNELTRARNRIVWTLRQATHRLDGRMV